jgi:hypothetical protein
VPVRGIKNGPQPAEIAAGHGSAAGCGPRAPMSCIAVQISLINAQALISNFKVVSNQKFFRLV